MCWWHSTVGPEPPEVLGVRAPGAEHGEASPPRSSSRGSRKEKRQSESARECIQKEEGEKKAGEIKAQSKGNSLMRRAAGERGSRSSAQAAPCPHPCPG